MHLCDKAVKHGLLFSGMSDVVQMNVASACSCVAAPVNTAVFCGFMTVVAGL